jgi:hypothetical protein
LDIPGTNDAQKEEIKKKEKKNEKVIERKVYPKTSTLKSFKIT